MSQNVLPENVKFDEEDIEKIKAFGTWYINSRGYCINVKRHPVTGKSVTTGLHRVIMDCPQGYEVDHINHDGLDNRKENLRIVTHQQNTFNTRCKGYYFNKPSGKYLAQIKVNGVARSIGYFYTEAEARQAYLDAKAELHIIPEYIRPL